MSSAALLLHCCYLSLILPLEVAQLWQRPRELGDFKKAQVNGGTDNHSLKGFSQVSPLPLTCPGGLFTIGRTTGVRPTPVVRHPCDVEGYSAVSW